MADPNQRRLQQEMNAPNYPGRYNGQMGLSSGPEMWNGNDAGQSAMQHHPPPIASASTLPPPTRPPAYNLQAAKPLTRESEAYRPQMLAHNQQGYPSPGQAPQIPHPPGGISRPMTGPSPPQQLPLQSPPTSAADPRLNQATRLNGPAHTSGQFYQYSGGVGVTDGFQNGMQSVQRPRMPHPSNAQQGSPMLPNLPPAMPGPNTSALRPSQASLALPPRGPGWTQPPPPQQSTPSPSVSEPPSAKSSRNPSPIPHQRYDAMEGQFAPSSAGPPQAAQHSSQNIRGPLLPPMSNVAPPPTPLQQQQFPPQHPPDHQNPPTGIAGRRQYPQQQVPNYSGTQPQTLQQTAPGNFVPPAPVPGQMQGHGYGMSPLGKKLSGLSLTEGTETVDLMQTRNILPTTRIEPPKIVLPMYDYKHPNCSPDIMRCTLTKIPQSNSILQKARLPLGIVMHPFKDLTNLPVIQCNTIVRCRSCRTYINPFVYFVDQQRWKCNLCYRVNELPEEFQFDPVSKSYGDPSRRPEIKSATIEFIAPSEYMLRPPQPAVYLFVLDVSYTASETGYLRSFCETLLEELDNLPGDSRTQIGFITYDSAIHFYNLMDGVAQPRMMVVSDIDDVFLPCPENLLVNLRESKELVRDLLLHLPVRFMENRDPDCACGAALQAAFKLVSPTGGRVSVFQTGLPTLGPGALHPREDPNQRAGKEVHNLGPANDFYKKLSLDCSGHQVAVDMYILSSQYVDVATLSCISKYSGGCVHYYPGYHAQLNHTQGERFEKDLKRYLTRKIGLEAVMRLRCTRGLSIHTFHGNFFVRSTDLLSLPNINPDAGFAMQMSVEENLTETNTACFQAALLYTSSKGERRIRVHTLCLPVSSNVLDIIYSADQQAIVGLLAKMAVDRSLTSSLADARDALINACVDALSAFKVTQASSGSSGLLAPGTLRLLPLYTLAILKHIAFRLGTSTRLDERVFAMGQMKTLPLSYLMLYIYPNLYPVHELTDKDCIVQGDVMVPQPPILHLSSEKVDLSGAYLMDAGDKIMLYVCPNINDQFCRNVLKMPNYSTIPERMGELPELDTPESERLRSLINYIQSQRPFHAAFHIIRYDSKAKTNFLQHMIEDRTESSYSYYEFLQHLKDHVTK